MQTVAEIGYERPVTIAPEADLDTVLAQLLADQSSEVFVVDGEGRLLGVVPDYELLKARIAGTWEETTAGQLCSTRVACFTPGTACAAILKAFREGQHSRAAILDDGRLVGQISRTRLLAWLSNSAGKSPAAVSSPKFLQTGAARMLCGLTKIS